MMKEFIYKETFNEEHEKISLALDIYFPENIDSLKLESAIVLVHGGALKYGNDKRQNYIIKLAEHFKELGHVCISVDYRLKKNPEQDYNGAIKDACEDLYDALKWLKDIKKIYLIGGSAGGWICNNLFLGNKSDSVLDKIKIFINLWGTPSKEQRIGKLGNYYPNSIIIHGTKDNIVPFENSVNLKKELDKIGKTVELIAFEEEGHTPVKRLQEIQNIIRKNLK